MFSSNIQVSFIVCVVPVKYVFSNLYFILMQDMYGFRHGGLAKKRPCPATSENTQRINARGGNASSQRPTSGNSQGSNGHGGFGNSQGPTRGSSQGPIADDSIANSQRPTSGYSQGTNADVGTANSQRVADDQVDTLMSTGDCPDSNNGASGSILVREEPPKKARGRGKRNLTQFRVPPPNEKVMLKPVGTRCVYVISILYGFVRKHFCCYFFYPQCVTSTRMCPVGSTLIIFFSLIHFSY